MRDPTQVERHKLTMILFFESEIYNNSSFTEVEDRVYNWSTASFWLEWRLCWNLPKDVL